ncbi:MULTISPECIES: hypothetical protein [Clostridium]|uniref:Lipoprotein n=1 Tax=Clostridium intestinale DSM 6191 TaxID=1121320 RepID=A0A1M5U5X2_9CLOT|nr:hypothetical protein [Clostridium intestinale]SHH58113.1 hypothetical protein SAMN02745941_00411 [Clostridium intestinale DSM 6191]
MKKILSIIATLVLSLSILAGCGKANTDTTKDTKTEDTKKDETTDVVTTPSIVNKEEDFDKAISKDGTWIIAILNDLTIDHDIALEGDFKNGKKDEQGNETYQRKLALYAQDANKKVTARYTLTAPKLAINSLNARIQSGTFKGDLYVASKNFELVDAKVDGNIYFVNEEAQSTFKMDEKSSVTGKKELKIPNS